jgi:hypothetical protein
VDYQVNGDVIDLKRDIDDLKRAVGLERLPRKPRQQRRRDRDADRRGGREDGEVRAEAFESMTCVLSAMVAPAVRSTHGGGASRRCRRPAAGSSAYRAGSRSDRGGMCEMRLRADDRNARALQHPSR